MESQIVAALLVGGGIVVSAIVTMWAGNRLLRFGNSGVRQDK